MKNRLAVVFLITLSGIALAGSDGTMHIKSRHSVEDTAARGRQMMEYHNLELFAEIDYAARAARRRQTLLPTRLLIFGEAATEVPLIRGQRSSGLDLPLRVLVWEDETGTVWVSYSSLEYFALRHGLPADSPPLRKRSELLSRLSRALAN